MKSRVMVLMHHCINDDLPPGEWVVGVEAFRQQMIFLKQHCDVVDLKEILKKDHRLWTGTTEGRSYF